MEIDFGEITAYQRYKLMASLIVPRPIALITTANRAGVVNAAPFSMFNMVGEDPPIVMVSINRLHDGRLKDTAANILASREFVVHLTDEAIVDKMHRCGDALPHDQSELAHVGLTPVPSRTVAPPRIAEAPVAFECVLHETLETPSRYVFIGRVTWLAVRDGLVDTDTWRVRLQDYHPVGRFGASFYVKTRDRFAIEGHCAQRRRLQVFVEHSCTVAEDHVLRARNRVGSHGRTARHRLDQHQSEGIGAARKDQDVGLLVAVGKVGAGARTVKHRVRKRGLQPGARWSVADHPLGAREIEPQEGFDVLFHRQPADIQENRTSP